MTRDCRHCKHYSRPKCKKRGFYTSRRATCREFAPARRFELLEPLEPKKGETKK